MRRFVGKAHDLVFDGWTVTRTHTFDHARIHRRLIQRAANNVVGLFGRVRDVAGNLSRVIATRAEERKYGRRIIARLFEHRLIVQRRTIKSRRRARLQARDIEWQLAQSCCQAGRWCITNATARFLRLADQDAASKESARR